MDLRIIWGTWPLPDTHFQFFLHDSRCFKCYVQATANEDEEMRCVYYVTLVAPQFIHLSTGSISIHCHCVRALGFFLLCVHVCRLSSLHEQIRFVDQAVRNDIIEMIERRIRKHSTTGSDSSWWWGSVSLSLKSFQLSRTCLAPDRTRNKGKTQIVSVGNSACNQSSAESNPECTVQLYFGSIQCVFCFSLLLPLFCLP